LLFLGEMLRKDCGFALSYHGSYFVEGSGFEAPYTLESAH